MSATTTDITAGSLRLVRARRRQIEQVSRLLVDGECLLAAVDVYGLLTGIVGITDGRIVLLTEDYPWRRRTLVSIPIGRVAAVSSVDRGRDLWGVRSDLVLDLGGSQRRLPLRGGGTAEDVAQLIATLLIMPPDLGLGPRGATQRPAT